MLRIFFIISAGLLPALSASAAGTVSLDNPLSGINNLLEGDAYIGGVINRALAIIGSLALLMLVYGGLSIILAAGNDTKIKQGKSIVTYTAIGLVVIFMSYAAITFFLNTLGGNLQNEYNNMPVGAPATPQIVEDGFIGPLNEGQCPASCLITQPCYSINQPAECLSLPGCCVRGQ